MITILLHIFAILTLGICIYAALNDICALTIHNGTVVAIAMTFVAAFTLEFIGKKLGYIESGLFGSIQSHLISAISILVICFVMFCLRLLGGGDAKMAAALGLWLPVSALPGFIFIMSLVGGLLGVAAVFLKGKSFNETLLAQSSWLAALSKGQSVVPYGVALMAGAIFAFIQQGYLGV